MWYDSLVLDPAHLHDVGQSLTKLPFHDGEVHPLSGIATWSFRSLALGSWLQLLALAPDTWLPESWVQIQTLPPRDKDRPRVRRETQTESECLLSGQGGRKLPAANTAAGRKWNPAQGQVRGNRAGEKTTQHGASRAERGWCHATSRLR